MHRGIVEEVKFRESASRDLRMGARVGGRRAVGRFSVLSGVVRAPRRGLLRTAPPDGVFFFMATGQLSPLGLCGGLSLEKTYERSGTALMTNDRRA